MEQVSQTEYTLTVHANKEFLEAETTVYPVVVDPTIEIRTSNCTIEDATLVGQYPNNNYGSSTSIALNGGNSSYGVLRFRQLQNQSTFSALEANQIVSANLKLYCLSKGAPTTVVYVNQYSPSAITSGWWNESSIVYNGYGVAYDNTLQGSTGISSAPSTMTINISSIIKRWTESNTLIEKGLLIRLDESNYGNINYYCSFASSEYATTAQRPYLEIKYATEISAGFYRITNVSTSGYLGVDGGEEGDGTSVHTTNTPNITTKYNNTDYSVCLIDYYWKLDGSGLEYELFTLMNEYGGCDSLTTDVKIGDGETYKLKAASEHYYYIIYDNGIAEEYLTDTNGNVTWESYTGSNNQKWLFERQDTLSVTINHPVNSTIRLSSTNMPERGYDIECNSTTSTTLVLLRDTSIYYGINVKKTNYVTYCSSPFYDNTIINAELPQYSSMKALFTSPKYGNLRTSSGYGWRCYDNDNVAGVVTTAVFGKHNGIDYIGGTKFYTVMSGTVTDVNDDVDSQSGYYVTVTTTYNSNTIVVRYKHLAKDGRPSLGTNVTKGVLGEIGVIGNTGNSTGAHLHIDVKVNGTYVDPTYFF